MSCIHVKNVHNVYIIKYMCTSILTSPSLQFDLRKTACRCCRAPGDWSSLTTDQWGSPCHVGITKQSASGGEHQTQILGYLYICILVYNYNYYMNICNIYIYIYDYTFIYA